jgi:hypothetical protein
MKAMAKSLAFGAVAAAALLAVPADAQRTGSRIGRDAKPKDASAAMQLVADCFAARRPEFSARVLDTLPGSLEEGTMLVAEEEDIGGVCMDSDQLVLDGKELRFSARAIRTPLARAMLRRMLGRSPGSSPVAAEAEPWFLARFNALPANSRVSKQHLALLDFGHCVAVQQWAGTRQLLMSQPETSQEKAAVDKLVPVLGGCLGEGMSVKVTPTLLRDALVEPVYHLLAAGPRPAAGAK